MTNAIVPGSIAAIAQKNRASLAESFLSASTILILDCSGSMHTPDAPGGKSRQETAKEQLIKLQVENAGKLALVCFADYAVFSPGGIPIDCGGSTNMADALDYTYPADDTGTQIILMSDGKPNDPEKTLAIARKFKTPIQTIFIGPENDREGGRAFLEKLAKATGGQSLKSDAPGLLANPVEKLLLKA